MLFRSTADSECKSSQELIVLRHGGEHVLIPLPETYEEALQIAMREFGLDGELNFVTQDISGCTGQKVKIHSGAWKGISPLLTSVAVEISNKKAPHPHAGRKSVLPPATPSRVVVHEMGAVPSANLLSYASNKRLSRGSLVPALAPRNSGKAVLSHGGALTPASSTTSLNNRRVAEDSDETSFVTTIDEVDEVEDKIMLPVLNESKDDRANLDNHEEDEDEEEEKEEEIEFEEGAQDQSLKRESFGRQRSADPSPEPEFEHEDVQAPADASSVREEPKMTTGSKQEPKPDREPSLPPFIVKALPVGNNDKNSSSQQQLSHHAKVKEEKPEIKKGRHSHDHAPVAGPSNSQSQDAASQSKSEKSDDRFVVTIEFDDGTGAEENRSLFKTRGRHLVSKVLMQACKTFGIEDSYDRVHLVQIVEVEEEGELVEHKFFCIPEDTMAKAGAEPYSRFAIHFDDDE